MAQIDLASSEIQKLPRALKHFFPETDITQMEQMAQGITVPEPGSITVDISLPGAPVDNLRVKLNLAPDPTSAASKAPAH